MYAYFSFFIRRLFSESDSDELSFSDFFVDNFFEFTPLMIYLFAYLRMSFAFGTGSSQRPVLLPGKLKGASTDAFHLSTW